MSWHVFVLVWGDAFVERFARLAVPFLAMSRNIPALAEDGPVLFHAYTDAGSRDAVRAALAPLASSCTIDVRIFDDTRARAFSGPDFKYELQRSCLRDLVRGIDSGSLVLLDSNFVLADGTLAALAQRRREGYRAATVSFVRTATEQFARLLETEGAVIPPRELLQLSLRSLHHIASSFFVDADPFTPYPSQICWRVGEDGFVMRNFLPHPLMVPVSPALARSQSTMDYDLALRLAADEEIYVGTDSDEMLAIKFSDEEHQAARAGGFAPTPEQIGLFLLTCTNRRHRLFAGRPAVFHTRDLDDRFAEKGARSQDLIDAAYAWIDRLATQPGRLDARLLMYLKSHMGPIEDFMSPQLEPAALARLR